MSWCYCREFSSLSYLIFVEVLFHKILLEKPAKSVTSHLLMNINELVLLPGILSLKYLIFFDVFHFVKYCKASFDIKHFPGWSNSQFSQFSTSRHIANMLHIGTSRDITSPYNLSIFCYLIHAILLLRLLLFKKFWGSFIFVSIRVLLNGEGQISCVLVFCVNLERQISAFVSYFTFPFLNCMWRTKGYILKWMEYSKSPHSKRNSTV